jgi:hypothetical protein
MKNIRSKIMLLIIFACVGFSISSAQTRFVMPVRPTINFFQADMIYLNDYLDPRTQLFNPNAPGLSLDLDPARSDTTYNVYVYLEIIVRLRGDLRVDNWLVKGPTNSFYIVKGITRTLTARDFVKGASIISRGTYNIIENTPLKKKIINLAQSTSTVPAGTYTIKVQVYKAGDFPGKDLPLGFTSKTIVVPYSDIKGVFVEINDPKNGSFSNNLIPTFSWTTAAPSVTVRVFEAGINNRSPQDALTGNRPCLVKEVSGVTTLTYPQDAKRLLQNNKAYVLQVEANVLTNRGESGNLSRPVVFRITEDKIGNMLETFLNTCGGNASSAYSALRSDPNYWVAWPDYGNITLDRNILTDTDLQTLLNELSSNSELKLQFSIENQ